MYVCMYVRGEGCLCNISISMRRVCSTTRRYITWLWYSLKFSPSLGEGRSFTDLKRAQWPTAKFIYFFKLLFLKAGRDEITHHVQANVFIHFSQALPFPLFFHFSSSFLSFSLFCPPFLLPFLPSLPPLPFLPPLLSLPMFSFLFFSLCVCVWGGGGDSLPLVMPLRLRNRLDTRQNPPQTTTRKRLRSLTSSKDLLILTE